MQKECTGINFIDKIGKRSLKFWELHQLFLVDVLT